jgi:hypothetical protein
MVLSSSAHMSCPAPLKHFCTYFLLYVLSYSPFFTSSMALCLTSLILSYQWKSIVSTFVTTGSSSLQTPHVLFILSALCVELLSI